MSKSVVTARSVPVSSTGAASAGNTATTSTASAAAGGAPVVAPKGFRLQLSQMLAGWQQVIPAGSAVPSRGSTLSQATVQAQLQGFMGNYTSVDGATLALKAARNQEKSELVAAKALLALLKEALTAFLGANSPQLALFGLKPKAAHKTLPSAKLAVAAAKRENTRVLRGTLTKAQKADLKSGPMTLTVTPAPQPAAPADAASPSTGPAGK